VNSNKRPSSGLTLGLALFLSLVSHSQAQPATDTAYVLTGARPFDEPINGDRYLIRPGERLDVTFVNANLPDLQLTVSAEAQVVHSGLGVIDLAGKTLSQAREILEEALSALYTADRIVISIASIYPVPIQVSGMVKRPGVYYGYTSQRVSDIIDSAGGVAAGGSFRRIIFKGGPKDIQVDLDLARYADNASSNPYLYAGKRIAVPELDQTPVAVTGSVVCPRAVELLPGEGLNDLLVLAGGPRGDADLASVYVVNDPERDLRVSGGLQPGDQLVVPSTHGPAVQSQVVVTGAVVRPGLRMSLGLEITVAGLIEAAGGLKATANPHRMAVFRSAGVEGTAGSRSEKYPVWVPADKAGLVRLQASDSVHVPAKVGFVEIEGAVSRPGLYPGIAGQTVADYVAMAGGYAAADGRVTLEIFDRVSGLTSKVSARAAVFDGDRIVVREVGEGR